MGDYGQPQKLHRLRLDLKWYLGVASQYNDAVLFTKPDAWSGGFYELALELGPQDDDRLRRALVLIWSHPGIEGCYVDSEVEPHQQPRLTPLQVELGDRLCGIATLPKGGITPCGTFAAREEDGGSDWLYFTLPMGSLANVCPVGAFPFDDGGDLSWRLELDDWLRQLGAHVFSEVRFRLGMIGSIIGPPPDAESIAASGIPEKRWDGFLVPDGESLLWSPPNQGAPFGWPT